MAEAPRFVDLVCGAQVLRVDASLCEMASERVFWREFLVEALPRDAVRKGTVGAPTDAHELVGEGRAPSSPPRDVEPDQAGLSAEHAPGSSRLSLARGAEAERAALSVEDDGGDSQLSLARSAEAEFAAPLVERGEGHAQSSREHGTEAKQPAPVVERTAGHAQSPREHGTEEAKQSALPAEGDEGRAQAARETGAEAKPPALVVERGAVVDGTLIQAPLGDCRFALSEGRLRVQVDDGISRGELVLRLSYYLCAVAQGAVLIHACALRRGDVALVASGQSGNGKSTLSRLGVGAGLELLTDEVVMLFPDGRVCGTPFRSDFVHAGRPGLTRARYFLALSKKPYEALEPLAALAAAQLATSQCFELPEVALPRAEARRRLLAFLSNVEPRTLAFRKDPAAGEFVRAALDAASK